jgi:hypothetical protein
LYSKRLAEIDDIGVGGRATTADIEMPQKRNGISARNPAMGPATTDVKQRALGRKGFSNPDDGAEGTGEQNGRSRQKVRQRGVDVVLAAIDVVAEFVTTQNDENGQRVPQAVHHEGQKRLEHRARPLRMATDPVKSR